MQITCFISMDSVKHLSQKVCPQIVEAALTTIS